MSTQHAIVRLVRTFVVLGSLAGPMVTGPVDAADPSALRKSRRVQGATERIQRLERQLKELEAALAASPEVAADGAFEKSDRRYQMLAAGDRIVILDTQTGEARIIEPASGRPLQNVEVGRAWVVVTVLGNVMERAATK